MHFRVFVSLFLCVLAARTAVPSRSQSRQDKDQQVIDDFTRTRGVGVKSDAPPEKGTPPPPAKGKASPKRPKPTPKPSPTNTQPGSNAPPNTGAAVVQVAPAPIGLGYTILKSKPNTDEAVAVGSGHAFRNGDKLRIALETNTDGYLYIFNTENDSKPKMIYPHKTLDNGRNGISAHAREVYPADNTFEVYGEPATERLYVILSRNLLPDVPAGEELSRRCTGGGEDCDWRPTPAQWERIKSRCAGAPSLEAINSELEKVETTVQTTSLNRGIGLTPKEPKPAVVRMNASPNADVLMTIIEITHR